MEIRNRMADVVKLRCNACQDFLKLVIKPNWQKALYLIAKKAIETDNYADNYRPAFETMREIGVDNYSVDDMDVSFITQVVCYCPKIVSVHKNTKQALIKLRDDRNLTNHSNENEDAEELYLRGLIALCDLRSFIKAVDKSEENNLDDEKRLQYCNKYLPLIEKLKDVLDEERIELVQKRKSIDKDINRLISCKDEQSRQKLFCDLAKYYMDSDKIQKKGLELYFEFMVAASNAGVSYAHNQAATYFRYTKKDYEEMAHRIEMIYKSYEVLPIHEARNIIEGINAYLYEKKEVSPVLRNIADNIIKMGFPVKLLEDGLYNWEKI